MNNKSDFCSALAPVRIPTISTIHADRKEGDSPCARKHPCLLASGACTRFRPHPAGSSSPLLGARSGSNPLTFPQHPLSGKRGIRTPGTQKGSTVFETVRIDHSRIFPYAAISRTRLTRFERATPTSAGWCSNPAEL